jgi:hypothetical protein
MILLSPGTLARVGDEADGVECGRGDGGGRGDARTSGEETIETDCSKELVVCFYTGVVVLRINEN